MEANKTRQNWREAYRIARTGKLEGKALYVALWAKFDHRTGCTLGWMIERSRAPAFPSRHDRQKSVLNCFGAHNPFKAPAMDSPRFEGWRRTVARVDALVARLEAAGRIERDAGGYVERVLPIPTVAKQRTPAHERLLRAYLTHRRKRHALRCDFTTAETYIRSVEGRERKAMDCAERMALLAKAERKRADDAEGLAHRTRIKRRRALMLARDFQRRLYAEYRLVDRYVQRVKRAA